MIRSKNASIYHITVDILFADVETYEQVRDGEFITPDSVAEAYGIDPSRVAGIVFFDPGLAAKVNLRRSVPSGSPGEHDLFGCQYNDPMFDLEVEALNDRQIGEHV